MISLAGIHKAYKVPLHSVKVGVWCALSARRIVGPVVLTIQLIAKNMYRSFFPVNRRRKTMAGFSKTELLPTLHIQCRLCSMSSGRELSAVVFGQHVHLILILAIFSSGVV
jgi:hypothetical protein